MELDGLTLLFIARLFLLLLLLALFTKGMLTGDTSVFELKTESSLVLSEGVEVTLRLFSELLSHLASHGALGPLARPFLLLDSLLLLLLPLEFELRLLVLSFMSLWSSEYLVPMLFKRRYEGGTAAICSALRTSSLLIELDAVEAFFF